MQENIPFSTNRLMKPSIFSSISPKSSSNPYEDQINSTKYLDSPTESSKTNTSNNRTLRRPSEDQLSPETKQRLARDLLRTLTVLKAKEKFMHTS